MARVLEQGACAFQLGEHELGRRTPLDEREGEIVLRARFLQDASIDPLFLATIRATEEAIVNALIAAKTMVGVHGNRVHAIPLGELQDVLRRYNRLEAR